MVPSQGYRILHPHTETPCSILVLKDWQGAQMTRQDTLIIFKYILQLGWGLTAIGGKTYA